MMKKKIVKKAVKRTAKKVLGKKSHNLSGVLYDKKNWKMWMIVYGGIALILYGTLYLFAIAK